MKILWADTETYSTNDISRGAHVYAEQSECILFTYAIDDGPALAWQPHLEPDVPPALHAALSDPTVELRFHNVDFDRAQMQRWEWCRGYDLNAMRFYCTMTAARMAGMPGALDDLCVALGLPVEYSKRDGRALIRLFCVPDKLGNRTFPAERPTEWGAFVDYALQDVVSMRECVLRIPDVFSPDERSFYAWTALMNDRGVHIDRSLATQGMLDAARLKAAYKQKGFELSRVNTAAAAQLLGGEAQEVSIASNKAMLELAASYGVNLPNLQGPTIEAFLNSAAAAEAPRFIADMLTARVKANKASTSKYKAILNGLGEDDHCRGTISFYGAARTGRDAGRRIQPQNLARPLYVGSESPIHSVPDMDTAVRYIKDGSYEFLFDDPLQLLSDAVRGTITAPPGKKLCQADLSNIEGRVLPWLAGEDWKLDYFRAYDNNQIPYDNYVMAYSKSFAVSPETVTKPQRAIGKVQELASGYGGSVGAYLAFATVYRIDLDQLGLTILDNIGPEFVYEARQKREWYVKMGLDYGLKEDVWAGILAGVLSWRASHRNIVESWYAAERAFTAATQNPGVWFDMAHKTRCINHNNWLLVKLPSGRMLVYPNPQLETQDGGRPQLTFRGVNQFTRKFGTQYTTGPKLIENLTQAVARDCLFYNIPAVESAGYEIVMRVHDELVCETRDSPEYTGDRLADIIGTTPAWAEGLPMAAAGDTYYRYQK